MSTGIGIKSKKEDANKLKFRFSTVESAFDIEKNMREKRKNLKKIHYFLRN